MLRKRWSCPRTSSRQNAVDPRLVGDRFNLRADLSVGAEKTLVIYAHLDVVPAEGDWDNDPFQVVQKNGRVYGRGVSDCKGSIAALIAALKGAPGEGQAEVQPLCSFNHG